MAYAKQKITKTKKKTVTFKNKTQKRCSKCGRYM